MNTIGELIEQLSGKMQDLQSLEGLTLPLMSYGGSSMLVTLGWLGLLMRIYHEASTAGRLAVRRERGA